MTDYCILKSSDSHFLPEEPLGETVLDLSAPPLRVWQPKSTVIVLGRSQKAEREIVLENAIADEIPIFQRVGGGGCVVLDENCVCIAMRYPKKGRMNINDFLQHSSLGIQLFLKETYSLPVEIKENHDLTINNKKFLGCSLHMGKEHCLYYAVLLMDWKTLPSINRYLGMPSKQPKHRENRSHSDFLTPLFDHITTSHDDFIASMTEFMTETDWTAGP